MKVQQSWLHCISCSIRVWDLMQFFKSLWIQVSLGIKMSENENLLDVVCLSILVNGSFPTVWQIESSARIPRISRRQPSAGLSNVAEKRDMQWILECLGEICIGNYFRKKRYQNKGTVIWLSFFLKWCQERLLSVFYFKICHQLTKWCYCMCIRC